MLYKNRKIGAINKTRALSTCHAYAIILRLTWRTCYGASWNFLNQEFTINVVNMALSKKWFSRGPQIEKYIKYNCDGIILNFMFAVCVLYHVLCSYLLNKTILYKMLTYTDGFLQLFLLKMQMRSLVSSFSFPVLILVIYAVLW